MKKFLIVSILYWGLIAPIYLYLQFNEPSENKLVMNSAKPISTYVNKQEKLDRSLTTPLPTKPIKTSKPTLKPTFKPTFKPIHKPKLKPTSKPVKPIDISSGTSKKFKVSAYDLTYSSQHKTATGFSLSGKSRTDVMTIAADPRVLKMGTKVYIEFINSRVSKYNGIYTVRDTGGAIKGNKLDLYMGHYAYKECMSFGVQHASVKIIN